MRDGSQSIDVEAEVKRVLEKYANVDRPLELDDRLEDLKIDSLGLMELLFDLEEALDIQIELNANRPEEYRENWGDVRSAIATVQALVDRRAEPAPL